MRCKTKKILKYAIIIFLIFSTIIFVYFFVGFGKENKNIEWGVNFSQKHSSNLGLDWRENYLAILDDLGVKKIKLSTYWDIIETSQDSYNFNDLDWQIDEADKRGAKILLVIGMKTPRWPECHIPDWAKGLTKEQQQDEILKMLEKIVLRYKKNDAIWVWQVENEIFFPFGQCPWRDKNFLKKEVAFVKSLDERPVMVTDTGEYSLWWQAARIGDIVGTTLYRKVWFKELGTYVPYPIPPIFYSRRRSLIKKLFKKDALCVELQAEPWGPALLYDLPLETQEKSMNLETFKTNVSYAKKTGMESFYFWGAEWWYWMKEKNNNSEIWDEAKKLLKK